MPEDYRTPGGERYNPKTRDSRTTNSRETAPAGEGGQGNPTSRVFRQRASGRQEFRAKRAGPAERRGHFPGPGVEHPALPPMGRALSGLPAVIVQLARKPFRTRLPVSRLSSFEFRPAPAAPFSDGDLARFWQFRVRPDRTARCPRPKSTNLPTRRSVVELQPLTR